MSNQMKLYLTTNRIVIIAAFAIAVLLGFIYAPGLSGGFHLDDYSNLGPLKKGITGWESLVQWITSGNTGPLGRPISLLSFVIDTQQWPAPARPFIRTNIAIHILNSILLLLVMIELSRNLQENYEATTEKTFFIAIIAASLWAFHPYWISSTLYVIQRMTLLSASFTLLGIWGYLIGRRHLINSRPRKAYILMSISLAINTILGVFSKEVGVLLPLLVLSIEFTIFSRQVVRLNRLWKVFFLTFPASISVVYFIAKWPNLISSFISRPFSLEQRALTETRILWDYIGSLLIPRQQYGGLSHDSFELSTSLLHPITTLPATVGLAILLVLAIVVRKRFRVLSLSILFFFSGHILESTILPLELYYEHRNYVPSMMLFLPLALALSSLKYHHRYAVGLILVSILSLFSWQRASLWGQPDKLAHVWAMQNPSSFRATTDLSARLYLQGNKQEAVSTLENAITLSPRDINLQLRRLYISLIDDRYTPKHLEQLQNTIQKFPYYYPSIQIIYKLTTYSLSDGAQLSPIQMADLLSKLLNNSIVQRSGLIKHNLHIFRGQLFINTSHPDSAFDEFIQAYSQSLDLTNAYGSILSLVNSGRLELALKLIRHIDQKIDGLPALRIVKDKGKIDNYLSRTQQFRNEIFLQKKP